MAKVVDIRAATVGGRELGYTEFVQGFPLPRGDVLGAIVTLDEGQLAVEVQPELGERVRVFTRNVASVQLANGGLLKQHPGTAIIEIVPDPDKPDRFVRLCVGPNGIVLTTREH